MTQTFTTTHRIRFECRTSLCRLRQVVPKVFCVRLLGLSEFQLPLDYIHLDILTTAFVCVCVSVPCLCSRSFTVGLQPLELTIVQRPTSHELFTWIGPAVRASCHCRITHKITWHSGRLCQLSLLFFTCLSMCRLSTYHTDF